MAKPGMQFIGALRRHGASSATALAELQTWKAAALAAIGNGESGQIVSGSGNGVSFSQTAGMTNLEWFEALDSAIQYLDAGLTPSSRAIARII